MISALSAVPLQSLSFDDVQSRAAGSTLPTQGPQALPEHVDVPDLHIPTVACPQDCVVPFTQGHPSLATPLQLLSLPGSQVSLPLLSTQPTHWPSTQVALSRPQAPFLLKGATLQDRVVPSMQAPELPEDPPLFEVPPSEAPPAPARPPLPA